MTTTEPVYDPFSYLLHEDPYPTYAWMREHAPLYRNESRNFWALSRYADVQAALRNPGLFSSRNGISLEPDLWGPEAEKTSFYLAMDPPRHGRMRRLTGSVFKPRWVQTMEPRIRELARARLAPLRDGGTFDLADFGAALPHDVMCELIGIPAADRDALRVDNDLLNHCEDGLETRSAATLAAGFRLAVYYVSLINDRRRQRRDDLLSTMLDTETEEGPLTDGQLVAFLFLMVSATNESTGKQIGIALHHGWRLPEVRRAGLNGRAADWCDESLRFDSPSQMMARTLTEETVLHGERLPAGARVALLPASGNRDERVFADPDVFALDRDTSAMISFGLGPHFCPGAGLARLEITIALQEFGALVSDYEIDMDRARLVHSPHQRGFLSLPATVTRR
ncbi:cytochrome P450 [Micromonospora chokoriensis]|uniref:cytochrome P450 n=1 Tax=Micromonospora chokoriensis TaxID=356851 RepID=UPI0004C2EBCA|nr:cytochrome P450 [Micromonospora chokoriensis]